MFVQPPTREFGKALRDYWGATESALREYRIALAGGRVLNPPPLEILAELENTAGYLAVGQMPGIVGDAISEGRRGAGPMERRDKGLAVAYMMAASREGLEHAGERINIADKTPVKTVCEAFGVKRTAARDWRQEVKPAFLGLNPINGEILGSLMKKAGERYKADGRSASAIFGRCTRN